LSYFKLRIPFIETLRPVISRWLDAIINGRSLESGGPLTCNHKGQRAEEFDWERVSTFGYPQHVIKGAFSSAGVRYYCLAALSISKGLPWARRHNVDQLDSEGKASAFRFISFGRVVVGRFTEPTIGMVGRSVQILLNTKNMQVRKDAQAVQALHARKRPPPLICGANRTSWKAEELGGFITPLIAKLF
jgi:hypothetical protein